MNLNKTTEKSFDFVSQVYMLLSLSIIPSIIAVLIFKDNLWMKQNIFAFSICYLIVSIVLFVLIQINRKNTFGYLFLLMFTFLSGAYISPVIQGAIKNNGIEIVIQATFITFAIFFLMSILSKYVKNIQLFGKILMCSLIALILSSFMFMFFHSSIANTAISFCGIVIFSGYVMYDTAKLNRFDYDSPITPVLELYLDLLNIFINVLDLLNKNK